LGAAGLPWSFGENIEPASAMKIRPRFNLRTLAVVVTLICAYFAAWEATKNYASSVCETKYNDSWEWSGKIYEMREARALFPCLIVRDEGRWHEDAPNAFTWVITRQWHFWLLGPEIQLPFESSSNEYPRWTNDLGVIR
jgi:hypothetical protein